MPADPRRPERVLARRGGGVELLRVPAFLFGAVAALRGRLYDRGWLPVQRVDPPVVCVGNLTAGGTGKTPMVAWVVSTLERLGWRPGVASRGYASRGNRGGEGGNDEARQLARVLVDVPHVQDSDRVKAARALEQRGCDVIVLDDGFQHRRLHRDLDLVLVDATRPWGLPAFEGGEPVRAMLPRGLLREKPRALERCDAIVITRADQVGPEELTRLEQELARFAPGRPIGRARHRPTRLIDTASGDAMMPTALAGRTVDLVSGIGNPEAFEATVESLGATVAEHRRFPDHHGFEPGDLTGLGREGRWVVTTAKDAARLGLADEGPTAPMDGVDGVRLHVLEVALAIEEGAPVLEALLSALRPGRATRERRAIHEGLHG